MTFDPKDYPITFKILKEKVREKKIVTEEDVKRASKELNVPIEFIEYVIKGK